DEIGLTAGDIEQAEAALEAAADELLEADRKHELAQARLDRDLPDTRRAHVALLVTVDEDRTGSRGQLRIIGRQPEECMRIEQVPHATGSPRSHRAARRNRGPSSPGPWPNRDFAWGALTPRGRGEPAARCRARSRSLRRPRPPGSDGKDASWPHES